jgi:hypothetical protein
MLSNICWIVVVVTIEAEMGERGWTAVGHISMLFGRPLTTPPDPISLS